METPVGLYRRFSAIHYRMLGGLLLVRRLMYRFAIPTCAAVIATSVQAQHPDYEAMIALRSSFGFQAALKAANAQLSPNPKDATAAGVRALVYANAVDFLGMPSTQAREAKQ